MLSKPLSLAAAIVLSAVLGACATQGAAGKPNMKMSAMDCKQTHDSSQRKEKESAPGPESGRMKKAGCPMMAAKAGNPEQPPAESPAPSDKDPHADHRR